MKYYVIKMEYPFMSPVYREGNGGVTWYFSKTSLVWCSFYGTPYGYRAPTWLSVLGAFEYIFENQRGAMKEFGLSL